MEKDEMEKDGGLSSSYDNARLDPVTLRDKEMNHLRQAYSDAGRGNVQVRNLLEEDLAAKLVVVRIFRRNDSHFSRWSAE